ncbi:hypothetical protein KBZ21_45690, partial [Streptomyces sp. A73]|nr:hypothetical protein [Streptomyces sp. A73]
RPVCSGPPTAGVSARGVTTQPGMFVSTSGPGIGCPRGSLPGDAPRRRRTTVSPYGYGAGIYTHPQPGSHSRPAP